jgi:hypothetical protein
MISYFFNKLKFVATNKSNIKIKNSKKEQPSKIRVQALANVEACTSGSNENGKNRKSGDEDADYEPDDSGSDRCDESDVSDLSILFFELTN